MFSFFQMMLSWCYLDQGGVWGSGMDVWEYSVPCPLIFQSFSRIRIVQGLRWEARSQTGPLKEARSQPAKEWERCQEGSGTRAQRRMRFEVLIVWYGKRGHSRHRPTEARVPNGEQVRVANAEGAWCGEWEHPGLGQVAWCAHTSVQGAWAESMDHGLLGSLCTN